MKKFMLIAGMLLFLFTMPSYAGKSTYRATVYQRSNTSIGNSMQRSPVQLPLIDVVFDSDNLTIAILSSMECEASVFIYDMSGNIIALADSLDTILHVPESTSPFFIIRIESANWYATSNITIYR